MRLQCITTTFLKVHVLKQFALISTVLNVKKTTTSLVKMKTETISNAY